MWQRVELGGEPHPRRSMPICAAGGSLPLYMPRISRRRLPRTRRPSGLIRECAGVRAPAPWRFSVGGRRSAAGAGVRESSNTSEQDPGGGHRVTPELVKGHVALALYYEEGALDFCARPRIRAPWQLDPGDPGAARLWPLHEGLYESAHREPALQRRRRATVLDPLSPAGHPASSVSFSAMRRQCGAAIAAFQDTLTLRPDDQRMRSRCAA